MFKKDLGLENVLNYLWCDVILLVCTKQDLWEKYHSLVPLKLWNCIEHIISGKLKALDIRGGLIKENANLLPCVYQCLMADEAHFNTARFGDLTSAIQVQ